MGKQDGEVSRQKKWGYEENRWMVCNFYLSPSCTVHIRESG